MSRSSRLAAALVLFVLLAAACSIGRPQQAVRVTALFDNTSNLFVGSEVRVLGLPVGEVTAIDPIGHAVAVEMALDPAHEYPADANAVLKPVSLLGERFVQLGPPYTGGPTLEDGAEIPLERTTTPAEVDEVLRSFENFLESLDANVLAQLIDVASVTLEGNGAGLNDLILDGSETVRVLADSSVDLNALVSSLADLNESLATREDRIGSTLTNLSTVLRNLEEDRDLIIGAIAELQRATAELRPIVAEHGDPLVRDLDTLTTTLSTVDRNLHNLGGTFFGANELFQGAGRAIEYTNARLPLDNEGGPLAELIVERLINRLVGLCLRLDLEECSTVEFFEPIISIVCVPNAVCFEDGTRTFAQAFADAIAALPREAQEAIAGQQAAQTAAGQAGGQSAGGAAPPAAPPPEVPAPALPPPDPRLELGDLVPPALSSGDRG